MEYPQNILSLASNTPILLDEVELLQQRVQTIPGTVQYSIYRFRKMQFAFEDSGTMIYNYKANESQENYLELVFCVSGNRYCRQKNSECNFCQHTLSPTCNEKIDTVDVASFRFNTDHLTQFVNGIKTTSFSEEILNFSHTSSFSKSLPICSRTRNVLDALLNHSYSESMENIFINAQTQMLLLYSMECMAGDGEDNFTCKFLANDADREKIALARQILLEHISEPLTIRELSRKAAINECYLKKGFKEMYGTTIFDFFQSQRMEHAKYLLYEKGLSVTDVSASLGYSSISHFSTAFKKHTGLKPCELLFH
jgi:AraC family transcriptional regulator